ncbi:MAG: class I SAM-dependent methyltransferase [Candidatus Promineifilaceae bacterium]
MASKLSIKDLYRPALAEGEGIGTAYEYYAKRLLLIPWLVKLGLLQEMLIAGLPQKYGSSLDFLLLGAEFRMAVTVVDDRPEALAALNSSLAALSDAGFRLPRSPRLVLADDLTTLYTLKERFDLAISSEVLQRFGPDDRPAYLHRLRELAQAVAIFTPNADNAAHVGRSGLNGLRLDELRALCEHGPAANDHKLVTSGYVDMPPFPPGITRTEEQREEAATGFAEGAAMRGLAYYAQIERFAPAAARRRWSHIVYALCGPVPR